VVVAGAAWVVVLGAGAALVCVGAAALACALCAAGLGWWCRFGLWAGLAAVVVLAGLDGVVDVAVVAATL
jgi:hypothetical protein